MVNSSTHIEMEPPHLGLQFGSSDDAYNFYKSYACRMGFSIVRRTKHNFYGVPNSVTFACNKHRNPENNKVEEGFRKRKHGVQHTGCGANIVVRDFMLNNKWTIASVILEHNHELWPDAVRFMRCHRQVPNFIRRQIEINDDAGIPQHRSFHSMFTQTGGYGNCMFVERDLRNHIQNRRALKMVDGDANALMIYFKKRQSISPNFYYLCDLSDDGRLRNVFWSDARSRAAHKYFGDVITFDTTYLTNRYDMPFAPFVGVNHHGQSILLGCALLADECAETYEWLFSTWMACMDGVAPTAIITDQCQAICSAVESIFPNARHRLCLWHIMKKVPQKVGGGESRDRIISKVSELVYESCSVVEFESKWLQMLASPDLHNNSEWFQHLYNIRTKWVPIYVKKYFWAGMSTTQRSESMNAFFDGYVNHNTTLRDFVEKYDIALCAKWEKEVAENFCCKNKTPNLVSQLPFEKQMATCYTHKMFYVFQEEVKQLMGCHSQMQRMDGELTIYTVSEAWSGKSFEVVYCEVARQYTCECMLFQFKGIVCRHGLSVYRQVGVIEIPECYIMARWRKDLISFQMVMI